MSKQDEFKLYLADGTGGTDLWKILRKTGLPWDIGLGKHSPIERTESGFLPFYGDTGDTTKPFEVRLGKYVTLGLDDAVLGIKALREIYTDSVKGHQLGVLLD